MQLILSERRVTQTFNRLNATKVEALPIGRASNKKIIAKQKKKLQSRNDIAEHVADNRA